MIEDLSVSQVEKSALVPFSVEQMYALVNDVEAYPEYIDECSGSKIIESSESKMIASLNIEKAGFSSSFTTENTLKLNEEINMRLLDGPFEYLLGIWRFKRLEQNACRVTFSLDFKFKNRLMGMAFSKAFETITANMMQAFIEQAKKQYG